MNSTADDQTAESPGTGARRPRGRPATGTAMSSAERQKAYRDRKREQKTIMALSRNASQELPQDGTPRRLIMELDKAHQTIEALRHENALLSASLASMRSEHDALKLKLRNASRKITDKS
jgi:predicted RNase H-like nuclease (RuvC/YqgF family)